uniref:Biotin/lipoyl-binding protein n=1 Tax=Thermosphaera aggregans TaxID=54254 RepID=A0A7C2BLN1_9CREN
MKAYTVTTKTGLKFNFIIEGKEGNTVLIKDAETGEVFRLRLLRNHGDRYVVDLNGVEHSIVVSDRLLINGEPACVASIKEAPAGGRFHKDSKMVQKALAENVVQAPISGKILELKVKVNDQVDENTVVVLMESMKMIVEVKTHIKGVVENVYVKPGQAVKKGDPIIKLRKS